VAVHSAFVDYFFLISMAVAVGFMLWVLWNFIKAARKP
jgi:hypothetical protein